MGELREQLRNVGAVLDSGEQTTMNYGPSTVAAVRAFRQQYVLPAGDAVDPPTARLMHVASLFASTGGHAPLRTALRAAFSAADTSQPQELSWLSRYAILARNDQECVQNGSAMRGGRQRFRAYLQGFL